MPHAFVEEEIKKRDQPLKNNMGGWGDRGWVWERKVARGS